MPGVALALSVIGGAPLAFAQQPVPVAPAAQSFKLGGLELAALRDDGLEIPNNRTVVALTATPEAVAGVLREAGAPRTDELRLDVDGLLVRTPGHVVLIDVGFGPPGKGVVRESLAKAGVAPGDVTDVLLTHAHPDHAGGLVDAQGRSAFPKATIRMSANEWAFMKRESDTRAIAAAIRRQVSTFEPGRPILPGITPRALYGHTPGHVMYEIASEGHALLDIGDAAHSSIVSLAKPEWTIQWDSDKGAGVRQREAELERLATSHELIFAPHFPYPGVGRIERSGEGFRFRPELPGGP
jgi:glyoxylase-like metal-dependent hydrolase (beta-lactamase superfamily II)